MRLRFLIFALFAGLAAAQTTSTITGTINDLTGSPVTSGKVTFTLRPSADTTISGVARFTPSTLTCLLNGSGQVKALDGSSPCIVTLNTALQPTGSYYQVDIWPGNVKTSSFNFYAVNSSYDITTVVPTPTSSPAQNFVDIFSNQTIGGNKTFSGNLSLLGTNAFSGTNTFSGSNAFTGTFGFTGSGVFTNTQMNQPLTAVLNGMNFLAQFQSTNGAGVHGTDVFAAGMTVPATATVTQANGFGSYVQNLSPVTNAVGFFSSVTGHASNTNNWGANFLCQIDAGFTGVKCTANELDVNNDQADATEGQSLIQDGINVISGGLHRPRAGVVVSASAPGQNEFQDAFSANAYKTFGLKLQGGASGSIAEYIVPPDDTIALEFAGRNAANTLNSWSIQNSGNSNWQLMTAFGQQLTESTGLVVAAAGIEVFRGNSSTHQAELSNNNATFYRVTQTVGTGTSTSNGTAIASGTSQAQPAITITGATTLDSATCALNAAPVATWQTGIQFLPAVVTTNTVTPWLSNPTAGSITPAGATIRCTLAR